jgi:LPXTG-site transpeptidase (sortase) family protein
VLYHARVGDRIVVSWKGKTYAYKVAGVYTVKPTDIGWLQRAGRDRLTLYTCTVRFVGDKRTVVVAYPVGGGNAVSATHP